MPRLGEFLRKTRNELGLTQSQLAEEAGIDQANVSRIENGRNSTPADEMLQRIGGALQKQGVEGMYEKLRELRDEAAQAEREVSEVARSREPEPLRIGFAHCIWSAPLILMKVEKVSPYRLYSQARPTNGPGSPLKPFDAEENEEEGNGEGRAVNGGNGNGARSRNHGATAPELLDLVHQGELDGVLVAQEVLDDQEVSDSDQPRLIPCAQILHGVGGSQIVIVSNPRKHFPQGSSASVAWTELIGGFSDPDSETTLPVLYVEGTNGEHHFSWLSDLPLSERPRMKSVFIDLADWESVIRKVRDQVKDCGACVLILWEPYISWALKEFRRRVPRLDPDEAGEGLHVTPGYIYELGKAGQPLPHVSFTLALREDVVQRCLTDPQFQKFLGDLEDRCRSIRRVPASSGTRVANYLNMPEDRCREELRRLPFRMSYAPEWVEALLNGRVVKPSDRTGGATGRR